jgi:hypothetical protein
MWLTSSKVLPVIFLVVIPFSVTFLAPVLSAFFPFIVSTVAGFPYAFSYIYLISASGLVYAFYPIKFRNIERRGFSNLLIEHAYIKKILYFEVPILIAITSFFSLLGFIPNFSFPIDYSFLMIIEEPLSKYSITLTRNVPGGPSTEALHGIGIASIALNGLMINLGFSVTAGIIWMILVAARKELGYYFAKSLFQTITREAEESKKAQYLIKAIKIYDKYLRRTLNLEINDVKKIYSKILSDFNINKNESIQLISESFNSYDKLQPIKCLSKILNVQDTDTFLVDESIGKKIKDLAIFFATIIPVAITVIQLLLQRQ